jgi:hypothetical protein
MSPKSPTPILAGQHRSARGRRPELGGNSAGDSARSTHSVLESSTQQKEGIQYFTSGGLATYLTDFEAIIEKDPASSQPEFRDHLRAAIDEKRCVVVVMNLHSSARRYPRRELAGYLTVDRYSGVSDRISVNHIFVTPKYAAADFEVELCLLADAANYIVCDEMTVSAEMADSARERLLEQIGFRADERAGWIWKSPFAEAALEYRWVH